VTDKNGTTWFRSGTQVYRIVAGKVNRISDKEGLNHPARLLFLDNEHNLWLLCGEHISDSSASMIARFDGTRFQIRSRENGLSGPARACVYRDREDDLWIATQQGLNCFQLPRAHPVSPSDGLPAGSISDIFVDHGKRLWVAVDNHGLYFYDGARFRPAPIELLTSGTIRAITELVPGEIWLTRDKATYRCYGGKLVEKTHTYFGAPNMMATTLAADREGALWLCGQGKIIRSSHGVKKTFGPADGLPNCWYYCFTSYPDREDGMWISSDQGLLHYSSGKFQKYGPQNGLPDVPATSFYEDNSGTVWIGLWGGGLARFRNGAFKVINSNTGLFADGIFQILSTGDGALWFTTSKGIFWVDRNELDAFMNGLRGEYSLHSPNSSDRAARQQCAAGIERSAAITANGDLWFATLNGLVRFSTHQPIDPISTVSIEEITANGAPQFPNGRSITARPGHGTVDIQYSAPTFRNTENLVFRTMLDGFDRNWVDRGHRREVEYTNLPPGRYRFRVTAHVEGSPTYWPETSIDIVLQPYFYQTAWFRLALIALFFCMLAVLYRIRTGQLKRKNLELEINVAERTHDLLQAKEDLSMQNLQLQDMQAELESQNDELVIAHMQLAEHNRTLEGLATTDGLTGLKNHRAFQEQLDLEWKQCARYHRRLSLILLDVDSFKSFNDTHGHPAGDEVLKSVGRILAGQARDSDFVARYGGEEFVIILPNTDLDGAVSLAERFRSAIEEAIWPLRPVTASFGVATNSPLMPAAAELTSQADAALYQSKRTGRNRVTHATEIVTR